MEFFKKIFKRKEKKVEEPKATEPYAKKVYWTINVPKKTKASMIESYNVERESEAELLIQKGAYLFLYKAIYDNAKQIWKLFAELRQGKIANIL